MSSEGIEPIYANVFRLTIGPYDALMEFGFRTLAAQQPRPEPDEEDHELSEYETVARITMSLGHAKSMLPLMARLIADYEAKFGQIPAPGFDDFAKERLPMTTQAVGSFDLEPEPTISSASTAHPPERQAPSAGELTELLSQILHYDVLAIETARRPHPTARQAIEDMLASILGYPVEVATDEELLAIGRALMAEDEGELGPIPEDVRAEVERQWRD